MKMRDYIIRRLLLLIPVLLGVSIIAFTLSRVIGDPVAAYITERTTEFQIEQIRKAYHLNDPLYIQYFYYLSSLLQGDWGYSRSVSLSVTAAIGRFFPATFELTLIAVAASLILGIPLGIISATKKDRPLDHASRLFSLSGVSMPAFWFGLILLYVFYYIFKTSGLPFLPFGQRTDYFLALRYPIQTVTGFLTVDTLITGNIVMFVDAVAHLILPGFTLAFVSLAYITRMTRSSMLEVLRQDYIILARSKGLAERVVIYKHALKNAMIPTVTVAGLSFGGLLGGAVLTETVFSWPGMGRWAAGAILTNDYAAVVGYMMVSAIIFVVVNLIVDLLYASLDPRIRFG